ncbi:MAG TPA: pyridoxamine 5'-phosphate oxidase family protein [Bradyrhizobium sp.]|nr:pyridoxamine 5'-phosphate oxidase family protein [Bradyrhizobium sp.]
MSTLTEKFNPTERSRVRLMRQRGSYDRASIYKILDSALVCNVGYVINGQPYVTPTAFWRERNHVYWHGSSASRALTAQSGGIPVCLTVAHVDGLVMARSGFHSSVNYRAVMAFGKAHLVEDLEQKRSAMDVYMNRFCPDRATTNRQTTDRELEVTKVLVMEIDEASAKVRTGMPVDDDEDYALPIWAGTINFKTVVESVSSDPRNLPEVKIPPGVLPYAAGRTIDEVLCEIYDGDNPGR